MLIGSFESILEDGGIAAIMKTFMADQENMKKNRKYHSNIINAKCLKSAKC